MITRRRIVLALGAGAFAPFATFAQQRKVWRIGFLWIRNPSDFLPFSDAFKAGMSALGYAEGRDYVIEFRAAQGDLARLPALAAELVALKVDVIVSSGTPTVVAASKATREIPILLTTAGDPVGNGLVASLARPGGNITGLTSLTTELFTKRLDLLRQILPKMRRVGILYDANDPNDALSLKRIESDCGKLQIQPVRAPVRKAEEFAAAFNTLTSHKAQALLVTNTAITSVSIASVIDHAAKHRLPTSHGSSNWVEAGGLFAYAADFPDLYRRVAAYADKIFKGAKPGDLPIEQPTRFEFVLNMKTAKALGLKIPGSILVQVTKVIE